MKIKRFLWIPVYLLWAAILVAQSVSIFKLPTADNSSSFDVIDSDNQPLLSVTGDGKVGINKSDPTTELDVNGMVTAKAYVGDGRALDIIRPVAAYTGGNSLIRLYEYVRVIKQVSITVPSEGTVITKAAGYARWESKGLDHARLCISMSSTFDPVDFSNYLTWCTDYGCTDSSDQYQSVSFERAFSVPSADTYTFYVWADKFNSSSKTRFDDLNVVAMFFPKEGSSGVIYETTQTY